MRAHNPLGPGTPVSGLSGAAPLAYSPAITWVGATIGSIVAQTVHIPGVLFVLGTFTVTAGTGSGNLAIPLPVGVTAAIGGVGMISQSAVGLLVASPAVAAGGASLLATAAPFTTSTAYTFQFTVPVAN